MSLKEDCRGLAVPATVEAYGLTLQQLMAVLQFAAEGFVLPPSAR